MASLPISAAGFTSAFTCPALMGGGRTYICPNQVFERIGCSYAQVLLILIRVLMHVLINISRAHACNWPCLEKTSNESLIFHLRATLLLHVIGLRSLKRSLAHAQWGKVNPLAILAKRRFRQNIRTTPPINPGK